MAEQRRGPFHATPAARVLLRHLPRTLRTLSVDGVPTSFLGSRYTADAELTVVDHERVGQIVRFGATGLHGAIGIVGNSGEIVEIIDVREPDLVFVNSSLLAFTETVEALIARYPYYDEDATAAEYRKVADELLALVGGIDPEAIVADRYWSTFADDVAIGDLTTEAIEALCENGTGDHAA